MFCGDYGDLLNCEECPNAAHQTCAKLKSTPNTWLCPNCQSKTKSQNKSNREIKKKIKK